MPILDQSLRGDRPAQGNQDYDVQSYSILAGYVTHFQVMKKPLRADALTDCPLGSVYPHAALAQPPSPCLSAAPADQAVLTGCLCR